MAARLYITPHVRIAHQYIIGSDIAHDGATDHMQLHAADVDTGHVAIAQLLERGGAGINTRDNSAIPQRCAWHCCACETTLQHQAA